MTPDEKINQRAARAASRIDPRTCRPDSVYPPVAVAESREYVREFTVALGLKPAPTRFGEEVVTI